MGSKAEGAISKYNTVDLGPAVPNPQSRNSGSRISVHDTVAFQLHSNTTHAIPTLDYYSQLLLHDTTQF
jgi:hypothetical protein